MVRFSVLASGHFSPAELPATEAAHALIGTTDFSAVSFARRAALQGNKKELHARVVAWGLDFEEAGSSDLMHSGMGPVLELGDWTSNSRTSSGSELHSRVRDARVRYILSQQIRDSYTFGAASLGDEIDERELRLARQLRDSYTFGVAAEVERQTLQRAAQQERRELQRRDSYTFGMASSYSSADPTGEGTGGEGKDEDAGGARSLRTARTARRQSLTARMSMRGFRSRFRSYA